MYTFIVINEREREIVVQRLKEDAGPSTEVHFSWIQFRAAFTDWKVYAHSLVYICGSTPLYSLSLFLPSIIKGMGFTDLRAQAMTAPPYAIGTYIYIYIFCISSYVNIYLSSSLCLYCVGGYAC